MSLSFLKSVDGDGTRDAELFPIASEIRVPHYSWAGRVDTKFVQLPCHVLGNASKSALITSACAVVMSLRAAHHALAPPVLDHGQGRRRARPVVAVEGAARHLPVQLRAVGSELASEAVEHLDGQPPGLAGGGVRP